MADLNGSDGFCKIHFPSNTGKDISDPNDEDRNIFGGLIIKEGQHFRINTKEKYTSFNEKSEDWDYFESLM